MFFYFFILFFISPLFIFSLPQSSLRVRARRDQKYIRSLAWSYTHKWPELSSGWPTSFSSFCFFLHGFCRVHTHQYCQRFRLFCITIRQSHYKFILLPFRVPINAHRNQTHIKDTTATSFAWRNRSVCLRYSPGCELHLNLWVMIILNPAIFPLDFPFIESNGSFRYTYPNESKSQLIAPEVVIDSQPNVVVLFWFSSFRRKVSL